MIDIQSLCALNSLDRIIITEHARRHLTERNISVKDIVECVSGGEIIEQYEQDEPFPSCLILGQDLNGKCIHIVVSLSSEFIYLITAYYPNSDKWESDMKTRKGC